MALPIFLLIKAVFSPAKIIGALSNLVGFCIKHWKQIAVVGMAVTIFYQNMMAWEALKWVGVRTIPGIVQEYEHRVGVLNEQLSECELSRSNLKGAIENSNAQIDKWATISGQLQEKHDSLVKQLTEMRRASEKEVTDILAGPTPEGCEAAMQYLREAAKEDLRWRVSQ